MLNWPEHLHPMVVHFPIALFITALTLEIASFIFKRDFLHQCAVCLYVIAALISPLIVKTGEMEEHRLRLHHPLLEQHEQFALWTSWFSVFALPVLWIAYKKFTKSFRTLFLVCALASSILVSLTADKGGKMVYEYGVGVEK